jgi:hypothetical protein
MYIPSTIWTASRSFMDADRSDYSQNAIGVRQMRMRAQLEICVQFMLAGATLAFQAHWNAELLPALVSRAWA